MPEGLPSMQWLSLDCVARIILELALADMQDDRLKVYNVVNPHLTSWFTLLSSVVAMCGPDTRVVLLGELRKLCDRFKRNC